MPHIPTQTSPYSNTPPRRCRCWCAARTRSFTTRRQQIAQSEGSNRGQPLHHKLDVCCHDVRISSRSVVLALALKGDSSGTVVWRRLDILVAEVTCRKGDIRVASSHADGSPTEPKTAEARPHALASSPVPWFPILLDFLVSRLPHLPCVFFRSNMRFFPLRASRGSRPICCSSSRDVSDP